MSALVWWLIWVIICAAVGITIGLQISKRLSWYLPMASNAELSRQLTESLAYSQGLKESLMERATALEEGSKTMEKYLQRFELAEDMIRQSLSDYALKTYRDLLEDVVDRISRDVAALVYRSVSGQLDKRLRTLGSEYVLLRDLSGCDIEVTLSAGFTDWRTLQAALRKVEKFRPATSREGEKVHTFEETRQFNAYLGKLGDALFDLKWTGNLNFHVKKGKLAL